MQQSACQNAPAASFVPDRARFAPAPGRLQSFAAGRSARPGRSTQTFRFFGSIRVTTCFNTGLTRPLGSKQDKSWAATMRFSGRQLGAKKYKLQPWVEAMECRLALSISLNINDTSAVTDDLTLYNPPTSAEPFVQTVPMAVVNKGPAATVKLVVVPAGAVTLSSSSLTLQADGSGQVVITPASVSKAVGDITIEARVGPNNKLEGSPCAMAGLTSVSSCPKKFVTATRRPG